MQLRNIHAHHTNPFVDAPADMNGRGGFCTEYRQALGRYIVRLDGLGDKDIHVRPRNLREEEMLPSQGGTLHPAREFD